MNKYIKELILWTLMMIPVIYLLLIYTHLPIMIPTHFDFNGQPNDWTQKTSVPYLIAALNLGTYCLMLLIPFFDPKKKIEQMGEKYYSLRLVISILISALSLYMVYVGDSGIMNLRILFALVGAFYVLIGNYFQTLKPNYFIGIRSPWTLESDEIWKKTHRLGGRLLLTGGLIILLIAAFTTNNLLLGITFATITAISAIVPYLFSYIEFKKQQ